MDLTSAEGTELAYETSCSGGTTRKTISIFECENVSESAYSINCRGVSNVFGCVALRSKSYCILNKQYTKEEYNAMLPRIRKHMDDMPYIDAKGRIYKYGEFFPMDMSYCGYNQSQAFEYFPLTEKEAKEQGYRWKVPEERKYTVTKKPSDLPEQIGDVTDAILEEVIQCAHHEVNGHSFGCDVDCSSAFRITRQELDFYRQMNLPLPRICFNCRHIDRVKWRNVPALYFRRCMCDYRNYSNATIHKDHTEGECPNEFETAYAPDRPEIVYCEQCYNAEVA
jgi:hypothetical protein